MTQSTLGSSNLNANGTFRYSPGYVWFCLFGAAGALFLIGVITFVQTGPDPLPWGFTVGTVVGSAWFFTAVASVVRRSMGLVQVSDEGISVRTKHGDEIGSLRWSELSKVTATHKMAQLVLWDHNGNRRVVVDRNVESFQRIRGKILVEYAKVFTAAPLPMEFRRSNFWTADAIVSVGAAVVMAWASFSIFRNGQQNSGVLLFCLFEILIALYFMSINPQLLGASRLFEDRIELRGLFRRKVIFKKDVTGVEIVDFVAGRSGPSSMVLVSAVGGSLKIQQRYGSLPEIYLTLRAWLDR
ncbi:MAG TPA: hypothetical protein VKT71_10260 [Candidatus Acidoferrales bacterium]|nr:hypothetical protein [Candidatus Acidoferrales bacterium]